MRSASKGSSVSSTRIGLPKEAGVAAAITYIQRGVMTAVPKDTSLGFIRCTFICCLPPCVCGGYEVEFPIRISVLRIVRLSYSRRNEFAYRAAPREIAGCRRPSPDKQGLSECGFLAFRNHVITTLERNSNRPPLTPFSDGTCSKP